MHEFSLMEKVVTSVLKELEGHSVIKVEEVQIEVGDLTFLGKEELTFAYEVLTQNTILKGSKLTIEMKKAKIKCSECNYEIPFPPFEKTNSHNHYEMLTIVCPICNGKTKIVSGKDCVVKNIKMVVKD